MAPMNYTFDATQHKPNQGGEGHPVGRFPFTITNTSVKATKDNTGGMFVIELTSPSGRIENRYNLWNESAKAVEIAHSQLSALCHAVGIFKIDMHNDGAALRGGKGQMDIGYQKGEEPTPEKPQGGYVELKRVYDVNGNEPGRGPAPAPQPAVQQPGNAPLVQQGGAWNNAPANGASAPQSNPAPSWQGGGQGQPTQAAPWQGGGQPQPNPPWSK